MAGRILIIDSVATNRIVLRAKVLAAQYQVDACASCADAEAVMADHTPDLVLINLSDPSENRHDFCRNLRHNRTTTHIPIISTGVADTARARFAALDAGADDVLPRPVSDALLMARVRSLLRRRNVAQELQLRDGTGSALGFDEDASPRLTPARINVLSDNATSGPRLVSDLQAGLSQNVRLMISHMVHTIGNQLSPPDVFVIDGTGTTLGEDALFQTVSELLSSADTRLAAQLVIVPKGRPDLAAMVLDLGAQDVVFDDVTADELTKRVRSLVALKSRQDCLRDRVRNGLHAAVTDPLTGLYNRRYAETHMKRIADQARSAGCDYALMMLDIDHFKAINDTYGHAAGDMVLTEIADRLRSQFRSIDLVARVGGEEFMIAMPNTTIEQAEGAAERVRNMIMVRKFGIGEFGPPLRVTVSVGVAVDALETAEALSPGQLFARADAALYDAKSSGRNTIVMSRAAA